MEQLYSRKLVGVFLSHFCLLGDTYPTNLSDNIALCSVSVITRQHGVQYNTVTQTQWFYCLAQYLNSDGTRKKSD